MLQNNFSCNGCSVSQKSDNVSLDLDSGDGIGSCDTVVVLKQSQFLLFGAGPIVITFTISMKKVKTTSN